MFRILFVLIVLLLSCHKITFCQTSGREMTSDSLAKVRVTDYLIRYPEIRPLYISTDVIGQSDYRSKLLGDPFSEGKIKTIRTAINVHLPVKKWKSSSLSASLNYTHQAISITPERGINLQHKDFIIEKTW
jgi:hypothetical protein